MGYTEKPIDGAYAFSSDDVFKVVIEIHMDHGGLVDTAGFIADLKAYADSVFGNYLTD